MSRLWYEPIINKIAIYDDEIILIQDMDCLLSKSGLKEQILKRDYLIEEYSSEIQLRKALRLRADSPLLVVFAANSSISYDLQSKYPTVALSLKDVFPSLEHKLLVWLNEDELDQLYTEYQKGLQQFSAMNETETLRYAVQTLYGIDLFNGKKEVLIAFLIRYFLRSPLLEESLSDFLQQSGIMDMALPWEQMKGREEFFQWLDQEWQKYVRDQQRSGIDFAEQNIKFVVEECFRQGLLVKKDTLDLRHLVDSKIEELKEHLTKDLVIGQWGHIAQLWSSLVYLVHFRDLDLALEETQTRLDQKFLGFVTSQYNSLVYDQRFEYAPLNHRILHHIKSLQPEKVAVVCFDGLSFKEWPIIRDYLSESLDLSFKEYFSLAMIPTVTSLSRWSIFSGQLPIERQGSRSEESEFKDFLQREMGINSEEVFFQRTRQPEQVDFLGYQAVGLIYNFVDDASHSAFNPKMFFETIHSFVKDSELSKVIENLLEYGFRIFLTSDHGNVYCHGNGVNLSRYLVEQKATRAAIYDYENLAKEVEFPSKLCFQLPNIIGEHYIVTMKDRSMFGNREPGMTHGGPNIEEVIIPLIEVIR